MIQRNSAIAIGCLWLCTGLSFGSPQQSVSTLKTDPLAADDQETLDKLEARISSVYQLLDSQDQVLRRLLANGSDDKNRIELKELKQVIENEFDVRLELQQLQLKQLRLQLSRIESSLDSRRKARDQLVAARLESILRKHATRKSDYALDDYFGSTESSNITPQLDDFVDLYSGSLSGIDSGESIYNDKLKKFKFRLEWIKISNPVEAGEVFRTYYNRHGGPKIVSAWGEPETNSIIVVGPPEADQLIRDVLAKWEATTLGIDFEDDTDPAVKPADTQPKERGSTTPLSLVPTITGDRLNVAVGEKFQNGTIEVQSDTGESVIEAKTADENRVMIDIKDLAPGRYKIIVGNEEAQNILQIDRQ